MNTPTPPARSLGVSTCFAPCDRFAYVRETPSDAVDGPLPLQSPDGRPLKFQPDPGARFLCRVPLEELHVGKRVHSLNTDNRGSIAGHGNHRGDATVDIDWDNGNKSPGTWHFGLDCVAESLKT